MFVGVLTWVLQCPPGEKVVRVVRVSFFHRRAPKRSTIARPFLCLAKGRGGWGEREVKDRVHPASEVSDPPKARAKSFLRRGQASQGQGIRRIVGADTSPTVTFAITWRYVEAWLGKNDPWVMVKAQPSAEKNIFGYTHRCKQLLKYSVKQFILQRLSLPMQCRVKTTCGSHRPSRNQHWSVDREQCVAFDSWRKLPFRVAFCLLHNTWFYSWGPPFPTNKEVEI